MFLFPFPISTNFDVPNLSCCDITLPPGVNPWTDREKTGVDAISTDAGELTLVYPGTPPLN